MKPLTVWDSGGWGWVGVGGGGWGRASGPLQSSVTSFLCGGGGGAGGGAPLGSWRSPAPAGSETRSLRGIYSGLN